MKKNDFLTMLVISLVVVIIWIGTDFIRSRPQAPLKSNLTELLAPLNPGFDEKVLIEVDQVPTISKSVLSKTIIIPTPSPSPISNPINTIFPNSEQSGTNSALLNEIIASQSASF